MINVSVIVVSYNTKKLLRDCLNSLFKQTPQEMMEVWVVDNASSDQSVNMVREEFPQVRIISNNQNVGFAKANNQAIAKAQGRYILLLNPDTVILDRAIVKMASWMDSHPKVGIASCQLVNSDGTIQPSGGYFPTLPKVLAWMLFVDDLPILTARIKSFHPHPPQFLGASSLYEKEHFQDWVTGAFFLMRGQVARQVGLLDEQFFMYVEEMEYCFRAKKQGFEVAYVPSAQIIHYGGASSGFSSKNAVLGEYRGLSYFYKKHYSLQEWVILILFLKIGALLRIIIFGLLLWKKEARKVYVQALFS